MEPSTAATSNEWFRRAPLCFQSNLPVDLAPTDLYYDHTVVGHYDPESFFCKFTGANDLLHYVLTDSDGDGRAEQFDASGGEYTAGAWQHLAFVFDSTSEEIRAYLNGLPLGDVLAVPPGWRPTNQGFQFGDAAWRGGGALDEIRIDTRARDDAYFNALADVHDDVLMLGAIEARP